jgi:hypothetical protein
VPSTIPVEPNFLCGQQAMAVAWGQEPTPVTDTKGDYSFRPGVAIEELRGISKLHFATGASLGLEAAWNCDRIYLGHWRLIRKGLNIWLHILQRC